MIELLINNSPVVLPEDFQPEIVFENPYFTKSSTYSLDIELPVRDVPENIAVFGHCYRMESDPLPESYTASMRINGVMCFYGSAVPQGTTETGVKLQLLSGNSEMNFFSDEVYIDELDLGKDERDIDWYYSGLGNFCLPLDDEPTDNNKFARTSDFYNDVEHVEGLYMPFRIKEREDWEAYAAKYGNYLEPSVAHKLLYYTYRVYWQPYLLHVIKRIIKSQGYEVRYNDLEDSFLKHVFICNYRETREFAKALPHWTVNKFFDELEKFCALVVVADSRERTVDLYSLTTFYSNDNKTEYIEDSLILSEYAAEYAGPNTEKDITTGNVGFELNYNDGYVQLDEEILNMAVHHDYGNFEEIKNALSGMKKEEAAGILFHDSSENRDYIRLEKGKDMGKPASFGMFVKEEDAMNVFLKEVNLYGDLIRDASNTDKTILNIVPATMTDSNLGFWWDTGGSLMHNDTSYLGGFNLFLPTVERLEAGTGTDGIKNIQAVIDGDETPERGNEDGNSMEVALYDGRLYDCTTPRGTAFKYPFMFTDYKQTTVNHKEALPRMSLSLNDVCPDSLGHLYRTGARIDTSHPYTIYFVARKVYDPKQVFMIRNQKYACESIKITYNNTSEVFLAEGKFYRMENN